MRPLLLYRSPTCTCSSSQTSFLKREVSLLFCGFEDRNLDNLFSDDILCKAGVITFLRNGKLRITEQHIRTLVLGTLKMYVLHCHVEAQCGVDRTCDFWMDLWLTKNTRSFPILPSANPTYLPSMCCRLVYLHYRYRGSSKEVTPRSLARGLKKTVVRCSLIQGSLEII